MRGELRSLLYDRHPKLLSELQERHPSGGPTESLNCGDGWFDLIDTLCMAIQARIDEEGLPQVHVKQIKEKLGTLRFYIFAQGDDYIRGMIHFASGLSERICAVCGAPGELHEREVACLAHRVVASCPNKT